MTSEINSANEFRQLVSREQDHVLKDIGFGRISNTIYQDGRLQEICKTILESLFDVLNIEHSVVAISENAFISIIANHGASYPIGARVPKIASIAEVFKSPSEFKIQPIQTKQLFLLKESEGLLTFAIPLVVGGQVLGLIAYCTNKAITEEHISFLQITTSIISLSIQKSTNKSNQEDHKILLLITPREREVLALLPKGYTNNEIAETLGISSGTVKIHIEHILSKLDLKDRTQAAVMASKLGL
jgi:DNA-binding CsgD family transcriptional regulator